MMITHRYSFAIAIIILLLSLASGYPYYITDGYKVIIPFMGVFILGLLSLMNFVYFDKHKVYGIYKWVQLIGTLAIVPLALPLALVHPFHVWYFIILVFGWGVWTLIFLISSANKKQHIAESNQA